MPEEVRDLYETIARAMGRTKNDLVVEALQQVVLLCSDPCPDEPVVAVVL